MCGNVWQYKPYLGRAVGMCGMAYDCLLGERSGCNKLIKLKILYKNENTNYIKRIP